MEHFYIATVEVTTTCEETDYCRMIDEKDYKIIGIIHVTEEHQKQKPSYAVSLRTQKKHVRELYNRLIKPKPDASQ